MTDSQHVRDDALSWLQRWEAAGGTWQIVARRPGSVTVSLLRCDGGEEVDRFTSDSAQLMAFIGDRSAG